MSGERRYDVVLSRGGRRQTCWAPSEPSVAQQSGPNEVACWAPHHWPYLQLHALPDEVFLLALVVRHFLAYQLGHVSTKDLPLLLQLTALLLQFLTSILDEVEIALSI